MKLWDREKPIIDNVKEIMALSGVIGAVFAALGGVLLFIFDDEIEKINKTLESPQQIEKLEEKIKRDSIRLNKDSMRLEHYMKNKANTFAIGLRVDENGQIWYRHTDGELHRAYPDPEYAWEDFEVYVWYDENGTKKFCY